jgi:2-phosphosulpholactate phosphatase
MRLARWAVIDTFRAFTTATVALANGASRIIMVGTIEEALALRAAESGAICMGEVRGQALDASRLRELAVRDRHGRSRRQDHHPAHQRRNAGHRRRERSRRLPCMRLLW